MVQAFLGLRHDNRSSAVIDKRRSMQQESGGSAEVGAQYACLS